MSEKSARALEVRNVAMFTQGAVMASLQTLTASAMTEATVEQPHYPEDKGVYHGQPMPYVDVVLRDGWRIRWRRELISPEEKG